MFPNKRKQEGNLLVMSIVVMVVVGFLSLNLLKVESSNHDTLSKEVLGTQAWFLAHSGAEWGLTQLFPLGISGADTSICNGVVRRPNMREDGSGCKQDPEVVCVTNTVNYHSEEVQYFKITSSVTCGSGIDQVTRVQEVWAKEIN
ncbi:MSHA biogenesis protein MshP [Aliivibrio fischeri]|uniref:MSHA biogenesis protein MshP n=1 Tax=Aliivibrio fischeri TaxID=668 RepID=UPI00084C7695|nr:MSHA biogenesis protein MshP [Aliivibrio fischeri]OED57407.1 MSHA biogenesis protein MshP [Aliivibrio fischeri]